MTRHKKADKNVSAVNKEIGMGNITSYSSTLKDDCPKGRTSKFTYVDKGNSGGSPGSKVSDNVQVGQKELMCLHIP